MAPSGIPSEIIGSPMYVSSGPSKRIPMRSARVSRVQSLLKASHGARREGSDIGGDAPLARYAASRGPDVAMRTAAVNALNMSLLADLAPVDAVRGLGLTALRAFGPLRRAVMREGVAPMLAR